MDNKSIKRLSQNLLYTSNLCSMTNRTSISNNQSSRTSATCKPQESQTFAVFNISWKSKPVPNMTIPLLYLFKASKRVKIRSLVVADERLPSPGILKGELINAEWVDRCVDRIL